jgi:hypothetical protein
MSVKKCEGKIDREEMVISRCLLPGGSKPQTVKNTKPSLWESKVFLLKPPDDCIYKQRGKQCCLTSSAKEARIFMTNQGLPSSQAAHDRIARIPPHARRDSPIGAGGRSGRSCPMRSSRCASHLQRSARPDHISLDIRQEHLKIGVIFSAFTAT